MDPMDGIRVVEVVSNGPSGVPAGMDSLLGPQLLHEGVVVPCDVIVEGEAVGSRLITPAGVPQGIVLLGAHDDLLDMGALEAAQDWPGCFIAREDVGHIDGVLRGRDGVDKPLVFGSL